MIQSKVILEKEEYRFVEKGIIELNGKPDYRLQKKRLLYKTMERHLFV
jgi:hypothetical protein